MRKLFIAILLSLAHFTNGQEITKDFTKLLHEEDFHSSSADKWENAFNQDNLFLVQNGFYELYRTNKTSGYFIFPKQERTYESVEIRTALEFEKHKNKKQSAGIIIMTQANFTGGLIIEISPKLGYRVQRISSRGSSFITDGKDGWVKSKLVSSSGTNEIMVKTYLKVFDLYLNGEYVFTFSDIEYFKGGMGLFIGPNSKCKFDGVIVHGEEEIDLANTVIKTKKQEDMSLTQIIVKLRKTLNEKDKEIESLETKLSRSQKTTNLDTSARRVNRELRSENASLKSQKVSLAQKVTSMESEMVSLRKFKKDLESAESGDIVINLTNIVGRQNTEIEKLTVENNYYKKENKELQNKLEENDIELKRVSETNILIRDILLEKDSIIKSQEEDIRMLKRTGGSLKEEVMEEEDEKEEEKIKDKTDLLNQILEKERRDREKKKREEEESNQ